MADPLRPGSIVLVFTTFETREGAQKAARQLVEKRLAACVHLSEVQCTFRWDGEVQEAPETRLMAKTSPDQQQACIDAILEDHPYELPALLVVPADATPEFAAWVDSSTSTEAS